MNSNETRWHTLTQHETLGRLKSREEGLNKKQTQIQKLQEEAEEYHGRQFAELERIAGMTQDEARQMLTDRIRVTVTGTPDALVDITPAALADLRLEPGHQVWLAAKAGQTRRYREPVPENRPPRSSDHDTDGTPPPPRPRNAVSPRGPAIRPDH